MNNEEANFRRNLIMKQHRLYITDNTILNHVYYLNKFNQNIMDKFYIHLKKVHVIYSKKCRQLIIKTLLNRIPQDIANYIHMYVGWNNINLNGMNNNVQIIVDN